MMIALNWQVISVTGLDAQSFLQGQFSCDLNTLNDGDSTLGSCCTAKGRMVASMMVLALDEGYLLALPEGMAPILIEYLKTYAVFSKVTLNISDYRAYGSLEPVADQPLCIALPGATFRHVILSNTAVDHSTETSAQNDLIVPTSRQASC